MLSLNAFRLVKYLRALFVHGLLLNCFERILISNDIYTAPRSENLLKLSQGLALSHLSKIVARKSSHPSAGKVMLQTTHDRRYCHAIPLIGVTLIVRLLLCISSPMLPKNVASPFLNALTKGLEPSLVNSNLVI